MNPCPLPWKCEVLTTGPLRKSQQCNSWASMMGEKWHNREHLQVNSSRGGKLSGFFPRGSAPILPTSHCRSETIQKQIWGSLLQKLGSRPHPWQDSNNHRTKGRAHSKFIAGSGNHISHTSYQGDKDQHTLKKEVADIHTKSSPFTKKILNPHGLHRDLPTYI